MTGWCNKCYTNVFAIPNRFHNPHLNVVWPVSFSQILNDGPDDAADDGSPNWPVVWPISLSSFSVTLTPEIFPNSRVSVNTTSAPSAEMLHRWHFFDERCRHHSWHSTDGDTKVKNCKVLISITNTTRNANYNPNPNVFTVSTFKRQKMILEAKKRHNFDAEMWQLPHNNCIIYYRDRE